MDKRCNKCGVIKPIEEFHLCRKHKDGHTFTCKACMKTYTRIRYLEKKEHILKIASLWGIKNPEKRRASKQIWYERNKERTYETTKKYASTEKGREVQRKINIKQREQHPERIRANNAVNKAVRAEKLPKVTSVVCSICQQKQAQDYHHHKGYEPKHWLDVIPVCRACHKAVDKR